VQNDANHNVTALINTSGQVLERFVYDPYGKFTVLTSAWANTSDAYGWRYFFQGGRWDPVTGLYNFRFRDYSPTLGRWMEQDPLGYVDGANTYQMELSAPVDGLDPLGLECDWCKNNKRLGREINKQIREVEEGASNVGKKVITGTQIASAGATSLATWAAKKAMMGMAGAAGLIIGVTSDLARQGSTPSGSGSQPPSPPNKPPVPSSQPSDDPCPRPAVNTALPDRITKALPPGQSRTPSEVEQSRNFFERNRPTARDWWQRRNGKQWPSDSTHDEHPRALKDGGDPLYIEPGYDGPNRPHQDNIGPDGLNDFQRWGRLGGRPKKTDGQ
jgi:RHS repeat-associated protein